jgi:hypothetical protein
VASRSKNALNSGTVQHSSTWLAIVIVTKTSSTGPSPNT